jgi:D-arabinose 1-dehydrogenase-like Zn-dependent alcohol dehydrogenase
MAKMKAAVVTKACSDFEIQEREIPQPGAVAEKKRKR